MNIAGVAAPLFCRVRRTRPPYPQEHGRAFRVESGRDKACDDVGDQSLVRTAAGEMEYHSADCDDDASRHFQELEPDGMDLGSGQFGPLQSFAT